MADKSFLHTLRDAAKNCPNVLTAKMLRDIADDLQGAVEDLHIFKTPDDLRKVNGVWAKAAKILSTATTLPSDPPGTPAAATQTSRATTQAFAKAA